MHFEAIKFYCDVIKLKSFSKAAELNEVTQSTISQAVQNLEKSFNTMLINRKKRPWQITEKGEICFKGFQEILQRYESIRQEILQGTGISETAVSISAIYSVGLSHMNFYIKKFTALNPQSHVKLEYRHPDKVYDGVLNNEVDLGIVSFPRKDFNLEIIPWRKEEMVIALPPTHRLAEKESIFLPSINGEKYIGFEHGLRIRNEIDQFMTRNGVELDIVLEFDNIESIKRAVESNMGIALLPYPMLSQEIKSGTLKAIPTQNDKLYRPLAIIQKKNRYKYKSVESFIELLIDEKISTEILNAN